MGPIRLSLVTAVWEKKTKQKTPHKNGKGACARKHVMGHLAVWLSMSQANLAC